MQLAQLASCVRAITAHHQVSDDLNIILLQHKNITSIESDCICNLDKHTRTFIGIADITPVRVGNHRRGNVNFTVQ